MILRMCRVWRGLPMGDRIREPVGVAVGIAVRANRPRQQQAGYVRRSHAGAAVGYCTAFMGQRFDADAGRRVIDRWVAKIAERSKVVADVSR